MLVYFSLLYLKLRIIFIFLTVSKIYFVFFLGISFGTFTFIPNSIWTNQIINSSTRIGITQAVTSITAIVSIK